MAFKFLIDRREDLPFILEIWRRGKVYEIVYGVQVKKNLSFREAAREYGECLLHNLQCAGVMDDGYHAAKEKSEDEI